MKVLTEEEIALVVEMGRRIYLESLSKLFDSPIANHPEIVDMRAGWFATQAMQIKFTQMMGPPDVQGPLPFTPGGMVQ